MTIGFSATDRCDCDRSEQAAVRWEKNTHYGRHLVLELCAHHSDEKGPQLKLAMWNIAVDAREKAAA